MKLENQTTMFTAVQEDIMKLENQIPMFSLKMILQWQAGTDLDLNSILRHVWHTLSPFLYKRDNLDLYVLTEASLKSDSLCMASLFLNEMGNSWFQALFLRVGLMVSVPYTFYLWGQ